jgi:von Willebrand factor type A domain/Aerotolerance regulator N-terminal
MLSFDFANKLYLLGALAACIPLVIHLSRSRRTKKIVFSTTRFFTDQFLRSYRMSRLRELFLLALRMALFAFLAMALAQPFIRPQGAGSLAGGGPRTVVLVLDNSASMGYKEEETTLFKRAQDAALSILGTLGPEDRVALILAGDQANGPEVVVEPTAQFTEVQSQIEKAQPAHLSTDLGGAIARAEELGTLAKSGGGTAVYVISDMQDSGWTVSAEPSARAKNLDTAYFFVSVRPRGPITNRAITSLKYPATRPRVGVPFAVQPRLALVADDGKDVSVQLHIDGEKVVEQKVERDPGERQGAVWAGTRFYHTFQAAGWHSGHVEIARDNLAADNARYFTVEVPENTQTVPVLAVNGSPSQIPSQDELFFLRLALEAAPEGQRNPFELTPIAPSDVTGTLGHFRINDRVLAALRGDGVPEEFVAKLKDDTDLQRKSYDSAEGFLNAAGKASSNEEVKKYRSDLLHRARGGNYPLIVLANVDAEKLTEAGVERLEEYVDNGGKLLIFVGDKINSATFNALLAGPGRRHGGLSPGKIKGPAVEGGHIQLPKLYEHRALASFNERQFRALLGPSLVFRQMLPIEAPADDVLMTTSKGLPLLCEKAFGKGKVLLFASTCDRDWSDFPARPAFLVWSRFVADYLTQTPLNLQSGTKTGDVVRLGEPAWASQSTLYVRKPNGDTMAAIRAGDGTFEFRDTSAPGIYAVLGADQKTQLGLFAANLDGYESELRYRDEVQPDESAADRRKRVEQEFKTDLGGPPMLTYVESPSELASILGGSQRGLKLWDMVLIVVLIIGLFEPWLANQISSRLYAKPREPGVPGAAVSVTRTSNNAVEPAIAEGVPR